MENIYQEKNEKKELLDLAQFNFHKWNNALQTKNPEEVAKLYADDAAFLPTLSSDFKIGQQAKDYFEHFLQKNPIGKIITEEVHPLGDEHYAHTGLYDFEVGPVDKREIVKARFSYVWGKNKNGDWKIVSHHSSLLPS